MGYSEDLALAREYIGMRVMAEASFVNAMGAALDDACRELVRICYSYGRDGRSLSFGNEGAMKGEIDVVIDALLDLLLYDCRELAFVQEDDESKRLELMRWYDGLYDESCDDMFKFYVGKVYRDEMESLIAACMLLGYDDEEAVAAINEVRSNPWKSSLWKDALVLAGVNAVAATILSEGGVTFGVGRSNVSEHLIGTYGKGYISTIWMKEWEDDNTDADTAYFRSFIADNTACEECKEEENKGWQRIEYYPEGGWHANCRCAFIFGTRDEVEG